MKVAFLDRDGVINEYPGDRKYVRNWSEFKLIPGSIEGIRKLSQAGFKLFVVSNQAGISKGLYSQKDIDDIDRRLNRIVKKEGGLISGIYYCTHTSEDNCTCRKPKTGLLEKAVRELGVKPKVSFFVGDTFMDMQAGRDFGSKTVLVLSGKEKITNRGSWEFEPDYIFDNLLVAAHYLCSHYG